MWRDLCENLDCDQCQHAWVRAAVDETLWQSFFLPHWSADPECITANKLCLLFLPLTDILTRHAWHHFTPAFSLPVHLCHSAKLPFDLGHKQKRGRGGCVCRGIKSSMTCQRLPLYRKWDLHYIKQIAPDLWSGGMDKLSSAKLSSAGLL